MIIMFTDIHQVTSVYSNTKAQFTPRPLKHPQKYPLRCEDLDTMVLRICHIHIPGTATGYTQWVMELSHATAFLPKGAGEGEVRVQNLNTMIVGICHIQLVIASIECNASGSRKLQSSTALSTYSSRVFAIWLESLDAMVPTINH
jgi:hypothetical protein